MPAYMDVAVAQRIMAGFSISHFPNGQDSAPTTSPMIVTHPHARVIGGPNWPSTLAGGVATVATPAHAHRPYMTVCMRLISRGSWI